MALSFNPTLETITMEAGIIRTGLACHKKHRCLAYANNIVLISRSRGEFVRTTMELARVAQKKGLEINQEKTKCRLREHLSG